MQRLSFAASAILFDRSRNDPRLLCWIGQTHAGSKSAHPHNAIKCSTVLRSCLAVHKEVLTTNYHPSTQYLVVLSGNVAFSHWFSGKEKGRRTDAFSRHVGEILVISGIQRNLIAAICSLFPLLLYNLHTECETDFAFLRILAGTG